MTRRVGLVPIAILAAALAVPTCSTQDRPASREVPTSAPPSTTLPVEAPPALAPLQPPSFPAAGPVWPHDFPDPALLFHDGVYMAFATEGDQDARLQVLMSWDLTQWARRGDALIDTPVWAESWATWAPSVAVAPGGTVLLYYSTFHRELGVQCLSVATAPALDDRFADASSEPLACDATEGGAIDPSPFVDDAGRRFLVWKVDGVAVGKPPAIVAQRLSPDGRRLEGERAVLLRADRAWEAGQIEAPSMAALSGPAGGFTLLYSANWFDTASYAVGVATCRTPLGPCTKRATPVLVSRPGALGPGGAEFFRDGEGRTLVAYHAWTGTPGAGGDRALFVDLASNLVP